MLCERVVSPRVFVASSVLSASTHKMYPRRGNSRIIQLSETHMVDVVLFINEVKKKPIIYDCRDDGYGDRRAKTKAWNEVAAAIIEDWEHMSSETKESTGSTRAQCPASESARCLNVIE